MLLLPRMLLLMTPNDGVNPAPVTSKFRLSLLRRFLACLSFHPRTLFCSTWIPVQGNACVVVPMPLFHSRHGPLKLLAFRARCPSMALVLPLYFAVRDTHPTGAQLSSLPDGPL
jgi:hypothetical protein